MKQRIENGYLYLSFVNLHDIYDKVIIIDAGHGGRMTGAVRNGIEEKSINLDIVLALKEQLDSYSGDKRLGIFYTRTTDTNPTLQQRAALANKADADLFISVHCNSYEKGNFTAVSGTQVLYSQSDNRELGSKHLAQICMDNVKAAKGNREFGLHDETYWELTSREHTESYRDTVAHTRFLVEDAIKRQMVSDVPVCTFLSGGIDSSIVTAIAANYMNTRGKTLNTFSFDFKDNDRYFKANAFQPERDLPYVNRMLEEYETAHSYLECDENSLFKALFAAVDAKDMPGMTDVDASLLYFCSLVSRKNKVALTGECANEIFGGYPWFYSKELLER